MQHAGWSFLVLPIFFGHQLVTERPLHAHVAAHDIGSLRVPEKCGICLERVERVQAAADTVVELVSVLP